MSTVAEASEHICLKERRFRELVDLGVITRQPPGEYDLDTVRWEYLRHLEKSAEDRRAKTGGKVLQAQSLRLLQGQADALEMKNADLRASLLPRDDVQIAIRGAFDRVRQRALRIPDTDAPLLVDVQSVPEAQSTLTDVVYVALTDLANTRVAGIPAKTRS